MSVMIRNIHECTSCKQSVWVTERPKFYIRHKENSKLQKFLILLRFWPKSTILITIWKLGSLIGQKLGNIWFFDQNWALFITKWPDLRLKMSCFWLKTDDFSQKKNYFFYPRKLKIWQKLLSWDFVDTFCNYFPVKCPHIYLNVREINSSYRLALFKKIKRFSLF